MVPEQKGMTRNGVKLNGLAKEKRKEGRERGYEKAYNTIGYRGLAVEREKKTREDFQIPCPRERFGTGAYDMAIDGQQGLRHNNLSQLLFYFT